MNECKWCNKTEDLCFECKKYDHKVNAHTDTTSRMLGIMCMHRVPKRLHVNSKKLTDSKYCKNCADETYPTKYAHYIYLDDGGPAWTCWSHPDTSRQWAGITNPQWYVNMKIDMKKDNK